MYLKTKLRRLINKSRFFIREAKILDPTVKVNQYVHTIMNHGVSLNGPITENKLFSKVDIGKLASKIILLNLARFETK
jgi:hypothetical protein